MKPDEKLISKLGNFFRNIYLNGETSFGEIEVFFENYLNYIFQLNGIDLSQFDITISKVNIDETHKNREAKYKTECNQEDRKLSRYKILTKNPYVSDGSYDYFDAIMIAHQTIANKFTIFLNKQSCQFRKGDDIRWLINLFQIFGHEVHHIIQHIKFQADIKLNNLYLSNKKSYLIAALELMDKDQAKKLNRLINHHLSTYSLTSKIEIKADKKGYDYLDILLNDFIFRIPKATETEKDFYSSNASLKTTESEIEFEANKSFMDFICSCKTVNSYLYKDRCNQYKFEINQHKDVVNNLLMYGVNPNDINIPSI